MTGRSESFLNQGRWTAGAGAPRQHGDDPVVGCGKVAISQQAFRRADPGGQAGWIRGTTVIAPVSFVIATLILYWAAAAASLRADLRAGAWLVVYLAAVLLLSAIGSKNFGGTGLIR
jgi:hypothetical protein